MQCVNIMCHSSKYDKYVNNIVVSCVFYSSDDDTIIVEITAVMKYIECIKQKLNI